MKKNYDDYIDKGKDEEEKRDLINEASYFVREEDARIRELQTEVLCWEAQTLQVPIPAWHELEAWEDRKQVNPSFQRSVLTAEAFDDLRKRIRNERKDRGEITFRQVQMIAVIIGAITGLVGALIGLFAVLL